MSADLFSNMRDWMIKMREAAGVPIPDSDDEDDVDRPDVDGIRLSTVDKHRLCQLLCSIFNMSKELLENDFVMKCNDVQRELIDSQRSVLHCNKNFWK